MAKSFSLQVGQEPYPGYRLLQPLGQGGYGEVWEVDKAGSDKVALKFIPCKDSMSGAREIKAIQAIRQLQHPNLVRIDQVWALPGYLVVVMELAEGDLLDLLGAFQTEFGTPIVPEEVCLYLTQAADAIDFLNSRQHRLDGHLVGFQHCDIKPSNMLLFGNTIKLCDFGLASVTSGLLKSHRQAGTPDYSAPEVFQGRLSDRMDQYSLAISYCQLRTGKLPFPDAPPKMVRAYVRPAPDLSMLSTKERPIVARALSYAPQDRWPSCVELMNGLTGALMG